MWFTGSPSPSPSRFSIIISSFLVALALVLPQKTAQAYYGGLYGIGNFAGSGTSVGNVYYSGLSGLYGSGGAYGGLGGLYGRGLYGLGGLYGSSLYGLGGGLYGLYGGLGSLYGGSLYGLGGLYGSSIYGRGLYGLGGGSYGLYGGLGGLYGLGGLRYGLAEQFGTWNGSWSNIFTRGAVVVANGPIIIDIVQDPVLVSNVAGFAQLVNHPILGSSIDVTGTILNNQVILSGTGLNAAGQTIRLDLACTLTTATEMFGTFSMSLSSTVVSNGSFTAALTPAVI